MASNIESLNMLKTRFNEEFFKIVVTKSANTGYLNSDEYKNIVECVKQAKNTVSKTSQQYRRLKRYDVCTIGGARC